MDTCPKIESEVLFYNLEILAFIYVRSKIKVTVLVLKLRHLVAVPKDISNFSE